MGTATYASIVTSIIVAAVILGAGVFPLIDNLSGETVEVSNEGASWIRMAYITDQSDYSAEYSLGDDGITVAGQTGEYGDMILYADSKNTLCIIDDQIVRITGNEYTIYGDDVETFTVSRTDGVVSFDDYVASESVEWAYVPTEGGVYGSFAPDTLPLNRYNSALAAVGGFAGVYAYNENLTYDAGLVMDADVTDKVINSVKWALESDIPTEQTQPFHPIDPGMFDPGILNPVTDEPAVIDPTDSSTLDPEFIDPDLGGNQIMAVPTPTYSDGDWGYDLITVNNVQKAVIVSYSGTGGNVVVPATIGGYDVYRLGKADPSSSLNYSVFDNSTLAASSTLTISNGIEQIGSYAVRPVTKFTGSLVIPDSVTTIGNQAFASCSGFNGTLTLSNNLKTIGNGAFSQCTGFTGSLVIPDSVTSIITQAFLGCSGFNGTLTLPSSITTITSNLFSGCRGFTGSLVIPDSVTSIESGAFNQCTRFTGVLEIPSSVKTIDRSAFNRCTGLTGLKLNEGLESIINTSTSSNSGTFEGCTGMTGILVLPSTLTNIGNRAFYTTHFTSLIVKTDAIPSATAFTGSYISQVLDFSENEWAVDSYGLNAEEVRTDIEADSYLSVVHVTERTTKEGAVFDIVSIIPLALVAGFLLIAVWVFMKK